MKRQGKKQLEKRSMLYLRIQKKKETWKKIGFILKRKFEY